MKVEKNACRSTQAIPSCFDLLLKSDPIICELIKGIKRNSFLPCKILSWADEHFVMSSLHSRHVPLRSATPGANIFFTCKHIKEMLLSNKRKKCHKSATIKSMFKLLLFIISLSNLPWIIGRIYQENWCFDVLHHVLWEKALQKPQEMLHYDRKKFFYF